MKLKACKFLECVPIRTLVAFNLFNSSTRQNLRIKANCLSYFKFSFTEDWLCF